MKIYNIQEVSGRIILEKYKRNSVASHVPRHSQLSIACRMGKCEKSLGTRLLNYHSNQIFQVSNMEWVEVIADV